MDEIDWRKVVDAVVMETDYDIWKEIFLHESCDDNDEVIARLIEVAKKAAYEV